MSVVRAAVLCSLLCSVAVGFEMKELVPVRPGIQHMWYYDDEGTHVCLFQYKYVNPAIEKELEEQFAPYTFFVVAAWNAKGKGNFVFDGTRHTFRLYSKEKKVCGNVDPFDSVTKRIDGRLDHLADERYKAERMATRIRFMDVFTENLFSDELGQWAKARKLITFRAINEYLTKVDAAAQTLKNLRATMMPFNCAVGDKGWALAAVRQESKAALDAVYYVRPEGEVEMKRVGLTRPMITKLELKQRTP